MSSATEDDGFRRRRHDSELDDEDRDNRRKKRTDGPASLVYEEEAALEAVYEEESPPPPASDQQTAAVPDSSTASADTALPAGAPSSSALATGSKADGSRAPFIPGKITAPYSTYGTKPGRNSKRKSLDELGGPPKMPLPFSPMGGPRPFMPAMMMVPGAFQQQHQHQQQHQQHHQQQQQRQHQAKQQGNQFSSPQHLNQQGRMPPGLQQGPGGFPLGSPQGLPLPGPFGPAGFAPPPGFPSPGLAPGPIPALAGARPRGLPPGVLGAAPGVPAGAPGMGLPLPGTPGMVLPLPGGPMAGAGLPGAPLGLLGHGGPHLLPGAGGGSSNMGAAGMQPNFGPMAAGGNGMALGAHGTPPGFTPSNGTHDSPAARPRLPPGACVQFAQGFCKYGSACKFRHDARGPNALPGNPVGASPRPSNASAAESRRVVVLNIPPTLNNMSKLNEVFSPCGRITNIHIGTDTRGKKNPSISVIEFATRQAAEHAHGKALPWENGAVRWTREYELGHGINQPAVAKIAPYSTAGAAAASAAAAAANAGVVTAASATVTSGVAADGIATHNGGSVVQAAPSQQARPTTAAARAKVVTAREAFKAHMSIIERLLQTQRDLMAKLDQHQNNAALKSSLKASLDKVVKLIKEARLRAEDLAQAASGTAPKTTSTATASLSQSSTAPAAAVEAASGLATPGALKSLRVSGFSSLDSLSVHFAQYGLVTSIYSLGESRAIVTFSTANQAQAALRDGHDLGHDSLSLALCKEPSAEDPPGEHTPVLVKSQRRASTLPQTGSGSPAAAAAIAPVSNTGSTLSSAAFSAALDTVADNAQEVGATSENVQLAHESSTTVNQADVPPEAAGQDAGPAGTESAGVEESAGLEEGTGLGEEDLLEEEEEDLLADHQDGDNGEAAGQLDEDLLLD